MEYRSFLIIHLPDLILVTCILFYIIFRILWKREQKRMWFDNMEWWGYRALVDMYKNQGYPYPEIDAHKKIKEIILEYKI